MSTELATRPDATSNAAALRGIEKAAILLVAIGEERAGEIFRYLGETEVEALSLEIAKSRKVPTEVCRDVLGEAVETVLAEDYIAEGGVDYARNILERSLGASRAEEVIGRLAATIERRPFEFLRRTPAEQISRLPAQRVAADDRAGRRQPAHDARRPGARRSSSPRSRPRSPAASRKMAETRPEVVAQVETVMRQKLSNVVAQEYAAAGGVKSLADILNHSDRTTERNVLDELAKNDAELAEEVRLLLFTFEDVVKLDDRSIQMVLKEVDQKDLAIALRGVSEDVRARIFSNMSERGAELLKRGDRLPAAAAQARHRGGAGPHRRRRAPPRGSRRDGHLPRRRWRRRRADVMSERRVLIRGARGADLPRRRRPRGDAGPDAVLTALAQAEAEADAMRATAREEGLRGGRDEALAALAPALEALNQAVEAMQLEQIARAERLEAHAVDLGLFLAEKVLGGAIAVEPERVVEAVRGALRGIVERERVTVLVHPEDLELVREAMDEMRASLGGIEHCEVQAERRVSRGGADRPHAGRRRRRARRDQAGRAPARSSRAALSSSVRGMIARSITRDRRAARRRLHRRHGRVIDLIGLIVEATGLEAEVGEVCSIDTGRGRAAGARRGGRLPRRPHAPHGARRGDRHRPGRARERDRPPLRVDVSDDLLGRALDGLGRPLDGLGPIGWRGRSLARGAGDAARSARAPAHPRAGLARRPRARRAGAVRPRPAPRHLRRLRRRQVVAAGHDRPLDVRRRQRHLLRRRPGRPRRGLDPPCVHRTRLGRPIVRRASRRVGSTGSARHHVFEATALGAGRADRVDAPRQELVPLAGSTSKWPATINICAAPLISRSSCPRF